MSQTEALDVDPRPGDDAEARLRAEFAIVVQVPVAWAEMDYFGHVNHAVFFTYFESARIEYLDRIGFRALSDQVQIGPILASAHGRFRRQVTYPDTLLVGARTTELGKDRFAHEYRVVSRALNDVASTGGAIVVSYDYGAACKASLPDRVRAAILALEAKELASE